MPTKDVELIIRAKNEATKAIDQVNEALGRLTKAQQSTADSAEKTDSVLSKLEGELAKLQAKAQALEAFGVIATQFQAASEAAARLTSDLDRTTTDLAKLTSEAQAAATQTANLAAQVKAANAAYVTQKEQVAAAKTQLTAINAEVRSAESSYASLARQVGNLKQPNQELITQLAAQKTALDALKVKQTEAKAALDQQRVALTAANAAQKEAAIAAKVSAQNQSQLEAAVRKATATVERETAALAASNTELAAIRAVADQGSAALNGIAASEAAVSVASRKAAQDLAAVAQAIEGQRALKGPGAVDQGPAASATAAYRAQTEAVAAARQQMEAYAAVTTQLGRAMAESVSPSETLQRQFLLAKAASEQASAAYISQAQALSQLRGAAQGGFAAFAQAESRIRATTVAEKEATTVTEAFQGMLKALAAAFKGIGSAATQGGEGVGIFRRALAGVTGETRTALGVMERMRGQVLSLAAGFGGLFGVIQGGGFVIDTIKTMEAAENRLGAIFGQNQQKVTEQMRFLRVQADRLGIQFGVLSDTYSQFAVAANQANFTIADTQKIFLAVAEAGRVNKLSIDNLQGVFLALQQMISKGKVSSEELRRQMGDRLPGAFNIFAKALGVTTAELDKMMRSGEVLADRSTLLKFAEELNKQFSDQLPLALQSTTTALGRFQNMLFTAADEVAKGGFSEGLRNFLDQLNAFFKSDDGKKFFTEVGAAAKTFFDILGLLVHHIDLISAGFKVWLGFKLGQFLGSLAIEVARLSAAFRVLEPQQQTVAAALSLFITKIEAAAVVVKGFAITLSTIPGRVWAATESFATLTAGVRALAISGIGVLRTAITGLGVVMARIPQIALLMIAAFAVQKIIDWATATTEATDALQEHEEVMRKVAEQQDKLGGKTTELAEKLKSLTLIQLKKAFLDVLDAIFETQHAMGELDTELAKGPDLTAAQLEMNLLKGLMAQFQQGKISAAELQKQLGVLAQSLVTPEAIQLAVQYSNLTNKLISLKDAANEEVKAGDAMHTDLTKLIPISGQAAQATQQHADATNTLSGNTKNAAGAVDDLTDKTKQAGDQQAATAAQTQSAWSTISEVISTAINSITGDIWGKVVQSAQGAWDSIVAIVQSAFNNIKTIIDQALSWLNDLWEAAKRALQASQEAAAAGPSGSGGAAARARGGPIGGGGGGGGRVRGPGTSTSDSILARLSTGEFVIQAAAVKKYGTKVFSLLNEMKLPSSSFRNTIKGYAMGGPTKFDMSSAFAGALARFSDGGLVTERVQVDLSIGGQSFAGLLAPRDVADKLVKFALNEQVRSGGRKPNWYLD